MKKQILFVHSAGPQGANEGSDGLLKWLKQQLGADYDILHPKMPNPDYPEYLPWRARLKKELGLLQPDALVIGHSLGGSVLLKLLTEEAYDKRIAGLFLIATPFWGKNDWGIQEFSLTNDFYVKLRKIPAVFLYHSRGDTIVPFDHLRTYMEKIPHAKDREFGGNDHAFTSGIPELIHDIKNLEVYDRSF